MAITNYILHITASNTKFVISYKNAKFHKLVHKSGKFKEKKHFNHLMVVVPQDENEMDLYKTHFAPKVEYTLQEKQNTKTLYSTLLDTYFKFYENENQLTPRMNATEGKALKSIITHLKNICIDDLEVIETWKVLLTNWYRLDDFYQQQIELRQINSNINIILRQIKNGNSTTAHKQSANNNANDLRESL